MNTEMICYNEMSGYTINALCPDMARHMYEQAGYPDYDWWDSMYDDFNNNGSYYDAKVTQYWDKNKDACMNPDSDEAKEYARLQEQAEGILISLECTGFDLGRGNSISFDCAINQKQWLEVYAPETEDGLAKLIVEQCLSEYHWSKRAFSYYSRSSDRECFYDYFSMSEDIDKYMKDILGMPSGTDEYDDVWQDVERAVLDYCQKIDEAIDEYLENIADEMLDALDKEYEWLSSFECWLDGEYVVDDNVCEQFGFLNELEEI